VSLLLEAAGAIGRSDAPRKKPTLTYLVKQWTPRNRPLALDNAEEPALALDSVSGKFHLTALATPRSQTPNSNSRSARSGNGLGQTAKTTFQAKANLDEQPA
jgi:hypothetical protein